jgi:glutamine synthetase
VLAAGAHGVQEGLRPPRPVDGGAYRADGKVIGRALPESLDAALEALESDTVLCRALGPQIVETFLAVKRRRFRPPGPSRMCSGSGQR